jgi:hypothetical protein
MSLKHVNLMERCKFSDSKGKIKLRVCQWTATKPGRARIGTQMLMVGINYTKEKRRPNFVSGYDVNDDERLVRYAGGAVYQRNFAHSVTRKLKHVCICFCVHAIFCFIRFLSFYLCTNSLSTPMMEPSDNTVETLTYEYKERKCVWKPTNSFHKAQSKGPSTSLVLVLVLV